MDVGKVYRTRVTLTNVTLTINTLKLVDLSESLKDFITLKYIKTFLFSFTNFFIHYRFEPPGMISAGMSCYLYVTFEPKVDKFEYCYSLLFSYIYRSMKIFEVKLNF